MQQILNKLNIKTYPLSKGQFPPVLTLLYGNCPSDNVKLNLHHDMYIARLSSFKLYICYGIYDIVVIPFLFLLHIDISDYVSYIM